MDNFVNICRLPVYYEKTAGGLIIQKTDTSWSGRVWLNAAVLKIVCPQGHVGSNPTSNV